MKEILQFIMQHNLEISFRSHGDLFKEIRVTVYNPDRQLGADTLVTPVEINSEIPLLHLITKMINNVL